MNKVLSLFIQGGNTGKSHGTKARTKAQEKNQILIAPKLFPRPLAQVAMLASLNPHIFNIRFSILNYYILLCIEFFITETSDESST